jgi:GNAT superfamily N-acetyltransferase
VAIVLEDREVRYALLRAADATQVTALLADTFSLGEPMAAALQVTSEEMVAFVRLFMPRAVEQELSVVARAVRTGRLVGAVITDELGMPPPEGMDSISPRFAPLLTLLDQLDHAYLQDRVADAGEILHPFMVGVHPEATGRGVAGGLLDACLENGVRRGYRTAVTEATGARSQHVFRTRGFQDRLTAPYTAFRFAGRPVFAAIPGQVGTVLMERQLG